MPGSNEEADRQNRRVEFVIIKKVEERAKGADLTQPPRHAQAGGLQP
jgi:hypothetical protein